MIHQLLGMLARRDGEVEGQGLVEYALILVLVSIFAIATMGLLADQIDTVFNSVTTALS